jgi:hypothetical protein
VFDSLNYMDDLKVGMDAVTAADGIVEGAICCTGTSCLLCAGIECRLPRVSVPPHLCVPHTCTCSLSLILHACFQHSVLSSHPMRNLRMTLYRGSEQPKGKEVHARLLHEDGAADRGALVSRHQH